MKRLEDISRMREALLETYFSPENLDAEGSLDGGNQIWASDSEKNRIAIKISGFWLRYPQYVFQWVKLSELGFLPLISRTLSFKKTMGAFGLEYGLTDYSSEYREGAEVIELSQIAATARVFRAIDEGPFCNVYATFDEFHQEQTWGYKCPEIDRPLERSEWESDKEFNLKEARYKDIEAWWSKSNFSVNIGALAIKHQFQLAASRGYLEITGRPESAIAPRIVLEPDWFTSELRFDADRTSIWIGDTRIWNVEVRVNAEWAPEGLNLDMLQPDESLEQIIRNRSPVAMNPNSEGEIRLLKFAQDALERTGRPPKLQEVESVGMAMGYNRTSVRDAYYRFPDALRNSRGRPAKAPK